MYKLIDKLNTKYNIVKKENFKYECTFIWAVLLSLLISLLGIVGIGLLLIYILIALSSLFIVWIPEFHFGIYNFTPEKVDDIKTLSIIFVVAISIFVTSILSDKFGYNITQKISKVFEKIAQNVIIPFKNKVIKTYHYTLSSLCKEIK